ncbi:glycosyltransferase family protein [Proteiniphilum sp. UBA1028]|uniref:glycosyltransferase family protein n=1 Tax=Proteiniphilum sp. UBA1028 TaxID=1947251 RepID=UPI000E97FD9D|nr:glycosyltransferase family protein [Proteiniphilum sp. UBA1028]HBG58539.1 glycosyltransferase [Porphyromonadaceae bacterium]
MRFLFTVQGEGRGHFTQALSLAAILRKHGHEVVAVLVGTSDSRQIPPFFINKIEAPVAEFDSPNFTSFYKQKRPNILISVAKNISRPFIFRKSLLFVKQQIEKYRPDKVINFYEMITGMAYGIYQFDKKMGVEMIALAHQYVLINPNYRTSADQDVKFYLLRMLSRITSTRASKILALSFRDMPGSEERRIVTVPPLLRPEVFGIESVKGDYIHGYMLNTGYFEEVSAWHERNPDIPLRFFWDKKNAEEITRVDDHFTLYTLNDERFLKSMAGCKAYATTSGFESVCEALYFRKPILMVPVHIEQEFNAYDAGLSGAGVMSKKFNLDKLIEFIPEYKPDGQFREWVEQAEDRFVKEICGE